MIKEGDSRDDYIQIIPLEADQQNPKFNWQDKQGFILTKGEAASYPIMNRNKTVSSDGARWMHIDNYLRTTNNRTPQNNSIYFTRGGSSGLIDLGAPGGTSYVFRPVLSDDATVKILYTKNENSKSILKRLLKFQNLASNFNSQASEETKANLISDQEIAKDTIRLLEEGIGVQRAKAPVNMASIAEEDEAGMGPALPAGSSGGKSKRRKSKRRKSKKRKSKKRKSKKRKSKKRKSKKRKTRRGRRHN